MTAAVHEWYPGSNPTLTMIRTLKDGAVLVTTYRLGDGSFVVRARVTGRQESSGWSPALIREIPCATEEETRPAVSLLHAEAMARASGLGLAPPSSVTPRSPRGSS